MKEPFDDFLEQIKKTLLGHEEPYEQGAWERFAAKNIGKAKKPKKIVPIWTWAAAAAAVMAGAILFLQYFNTTKTIKNTADAPLVVATIEGKTNPSGDANTITVDSIKENEPAMVTVPAVPGNTSPFKTQISIYPSPVNPKNTQGKQDNTAVAPAPPLMATQKPPQTVQPDEAEKKTTVPFYQNQIVTEEVAKTPVPQQQQQRSIAATGAEPQKAGNKEKGSRWLSSLYVSPVFGSQDVNMGYGYQLGYAINSKLRVSSGIAYAKMSTSKNYNSPTAADLPAAVANDAPVNAGFVASRAVTAQKSVPNLQSVDSWVSGIDVPVEINYSISKKVYAAGGVSGLFVLDGTTRKTYESNDVRVTVETTQGKIREDKNVVFSNPNNAEQPESTPFLGFYNLSMGYKQKVSPKNSVSVEPFIKVPMKQVTDQKLNYTGVGVRLKFDF